MPKRKQSSDRRSPQDTTILAPDSVRRDLKVIAALTGSTMKEVLERLVTAELRKVNA